MTIDDVKPDNLDDAVAFFRQSVADGSWSADLAESLLRRWADPGALMTAIAAASGSGKSPPGGGASLIAAASRARKAGR